MIGAIVGAVIGGGASIISDIAAGNDVDWGRAGVNALKGAAVGAVAGTGVGLVAEIATGAGISGATITGLAISAGGIANDIANEHTQSGSFLNGLVGGEINIGSFLISMKIFRQPLRVSLGIGGASGSLVTDWLNNYDKPEDKRKSGGEMIVSAITLGITQILVGEPLY